MNQFFRTARLWLAVLVLQTLALPLQAATYGELAERAYRRWPANGYDAAIYPANPSYGYGNSMLPALPMSGDGFPDGRMTRWSYGQVNAASDPFYIWGLRTRGMYVPWSTPLSGWTNAQSWNWWRARAGDGGPAPPLW